MSTDAKKRRVEALSTTTFQEASPEGKFIAGLSVSGGAQPNPPPRWIPGFVLDLVCWARRHKPFPVPPLSWESYGHATRWEFCSRCGRLFGRKAA